MTNKELLEIRDKLSIDHEKTTKYEHVKDSSILSSHGLFAGMNIYAYREGFDAALKIIGEMELRLKKKHTLDHDCCIDMINQGIEDAKEQIRKVVKG